MGGENGWNKLGISSFVKNFARADRGSNTVEYALLVAVVALVCIPALLGFSDAIGAFWDTISTRLLN